MLNTTIQLAHLEAVIQEVCGNEGLPGCEEFYRGYNSVVNRERDRAHKLLSALRPIINKAEGRS